MRIEIEFVMMRLLPTVIEYSLNISDITKRTECAFWIDFGRFGKTPVR